MNRIVPAGDSALVIEFEEKIDPAVSARRAALADALTAAKFAGSSEDAVVDLHAAAVYRVMMLGFTPGFAYMGVVDARIAAPRLESPRPRVPRGSVGIAKEQTGIYPSETPGGWQLIGRTPV